MSPASSRWCPTPEQLMILEELYRSGIRTPNASQIQRITAHLSLYGKIEGKNVFYWFQNHKARDRQKLRRKLIKQLQQQQQQLFHHHHPHPDDHYTHHQLQLLNQSNHFHHHQNLLDYFSLPCPSLSLHPLHSSAGFLPLHHQGGLEGAPTQMNHHHHTWNMEFPQNVQMENSVMRTYGYDWMMMMMGIGPSTSSPCSKRPLETLELFPITATNLKEECNNTSTSSSSN